MKKKFDFSAEMNEAKSIKATPKNEYPEEEKRLLKVNVKELASLNDNVHYMITNLENLKLTQVLSTQFIYNQFITIFTPLIKEQHRNKTID